MSKKKVYKTKSKANQVNEPLEEYKTKQIQIFTSFEEQDEFNLKQIAELSSEEILVQLRQLINLAYDMHGYNPDALPKTHTIKIISTE